MSVRYYKSFSGYNHPVKLIEEISKEVAETQLAYLKGYYDDDLLIKVEKYLNSELFFTYEYTYDGKKLVKAIIRNSEGETELDFE